MPGRLIDYGKMGLFVVNGVVRGLIVGQNCFNAHIFELLLELVKSIHALNTHNIRKGIPPGAVQWAEVFQSQPVGNVYG